MAATIFVNLPVADVERTKAFYAALGAEIVPGFSDETTACVDWGSGIFFMMLSRERFASFTAGGRVLSPADGVGTLIALGKDSREEVTAMRETVLAAGGGEFRPAEDHGFMYGVAMTDPDGHVLEFFWMDPRAAAGGQSASGNDPFTDAEEEGWPAREDG
ncbi:VOC family protein [Microbacterium excoecariae]|uniref:VOC family protein n=1 Tax=Microbacterium excoecariae TaxID=2715210 RepID=UPI00140C11A8|nr:VOC family protein [Microbacterium excoecariae]